MLTCTYLLKKEREVLFHIFHRHGKVDGDNKFIMYWDANSLYG